MTPDRTSTTRPSLEPARRSGDGPLPDRLRDRRSPRARHRNPARLARSASIALAVVLAFVFGYGLTLRSVLGSGISIRDALRIAFAADTISIIVMEIVDNAFVLAIPGAMSAGLTDLLFWASLGASLVLAGLVAFPVNRWLIARGRGHAVVHGMH